MKKIILLFLVIQFSYSQEVKLTGIVKDTNNRGIESASVVLLDSNQNTLGYTYTDENGNFSLIFAQSSDGNIKVIASSMGFFKKETQLNLDSKLNHTIFFNLEENVENLSEVVIESDQKIKIDRDTTTIKIAKFSNKTEQTLEDILKKLPGIEVLKDGSIKAHGKSIDKLLIEGEDMFDKNYKLLSKNLDAKVLDAVQILDNFEDNPILKKLSNSDKVALNIKLKKDKLNIWFGNITLGAGVISENRWKEGTNLGLLRKKIKLFYLADYNNSGEKATDQITTAISDNNTFGEDRYEKTAKTLFNINSGENSTFSKSQSIFNNAFFNSLSFTTKIKPSLTVRGVAYFANDNQIQNSFAQTQLNIDANPILFTESNNYKSQKTLASGEIELKYYPNLNHYFTNTLIFKNNPNAINDNIVFNNDQLSLASNNKNQTFYNHFNHTYSLTKRSVLSNYVYFGQDSNLENSAVLSPFLNQFLNVNSQSTVKQLADNSLLYFGGKSKLISKFNKLEHTIALNYEMNKEIFRNNFLVNQINNTVYENNTVLNQQILSVETNLRYNFTKKIDLTTGVNYQHTVFKNNDLTNYISIFNPNISINIKKTGIGTFTLSYLSNNSLPEINFLTQNAQLTDYRSFYTGTNYSKPLKTDTFSFSHFLFNDEKRFSINTDLSYNKVHSNYTTQSTFTNDFNFNNYILNVGGTSYNGNFNIINYFRKLKLATKLETSQNWSITPISANNLDFTDLKGYASSYKFSATTYFKLPVNFDFGFDYNFNESEFNSIKSQNTIKNAFMNINYKISKTWLSELNSKYYYLSNSNYSFVNAVINYTPEESRFSYKLVLNNLTNENQFTITTLTNFTSFTSSINLVPRFLLLTVKYRF